MAAALLPLCGAATNPIIVDIAPYVYPANRPDAAPTMKFMPDGLTYLAGSPDNTRIVRYDTATGKEIETVFNSAKTRVSTVSP